MRQQIYLNPKRFENATEEEWKEHFTEPLRSGRVPGETLDFFIICPLAEKESDEAWKRSKLDGVVEYMRKQL